MFPSDSLSLFSPSPRSADLPDRARRLAAIAFALAARLALT
jgi:hypothetical protein